MAIYAGYCEMDITPPIGVALDGYSSRNRGADEIADRLVAQALYLSDERTAAVVISVDVCSIPSRTMENIRQQVSMSTGVSRDAVVICPSHTHFAPVIEAKPWMRAEALQHFARDFKPRLIEACADAALRAKREAVKARLAVGRAQAPGISFNRRPLAADGTCANRLRLPPDQAAIASAVGAELRRLWLEEAYGGPRYSPPQPAVEGLRLGVTDPDVVVLRVDTADGKPLVALVNFACHPVCGGPNFYAVSADYICYMRRLVAAAMEQTERGRADMPYTPAVMFVQGAAGDQVPTWREGDARVRVGQGLGGVATLAWQCAELIESEGLRVAPADIELPLREFPPIEELREQYERAKAKGEDYTRLGMMMSMAELIDGRNAADVRLTAVRIGEWALVTGVGEIVVEVGLHIKQRSPVPATMFASLSAGHFGYMATDEGMREGGYEAEWSGLSFGAAAAQINGALEALARTV